MTEYIILWKYVVLINDRSVNYPGSVTRFVSEGAQCLKTSRENPPLIIPGVAKRTQGPGVSIMDRSKCFTATSEQTTD